MDLQACLQDLAARGGSDLHLKVGRPPLVRMAGDLVPTDGAPVSEDELRTVLYALMDQRTVRTFEQDHEVDFSYEVEGLARFRVNVFVQRGRIGAVLRLIPLEVPTVRGMDLPPALNKIAESPVGLVLVTGPTGSGKSTSLAAMIRHINETRPVHIVTVEDPIEFVHTDDRATINQRELHVDTGALQGALRAALRQDPDVILMGEMRDPETIAFAITATETGHLVFATLHTPDAKQTVERILDTTPPDARSMVRAQLALLLRAIICQRLCKRADGSGRIAALEILINTANISSLIAENQTRSIERAITEGGYYGMQTFNQALHQLVREGKVSEEEALHHSSEHEDLKILIRGISRGTG